MTPTALAQGDPQLIDDDIAQRLLQSTELARLAYVAADGTPRLLPMLFVWNGTELVLSTFAGSRKVADLLARPDVTVVIDRAGPPPEGLTIRGRAELTEADGVLPEYAEAQRRYYGPDAATAALAMGNQPGLRMVRIAIRPAWVGVLDFQTRFPGGFAERGRG
jgi:PPOX class probable F420-dependent enzyme